jgi:galactan endo-1,6-beta-galactosidase
VITYPGEDERLRGQSDPAEGIRVIDPRRGFTWDGWGACLSWWANTELGMRDDLAGVFFGLERVKVRTVDKAVELPGLGLNIVRYNLGACTWPAGGSGRGDRGEMAESPHIVRRKQIEAYWDGDEWDWGADANQRTMLLKARDAGADTFEMFSVSPPWWMTVNGNPSGIGRGNRDNLALAGRQAFARYIAVVTRRARDVWGVRFGSVEPFNEPSLGAWHADQNQEGCCFSLRAQESVIARVRRALDENGLDDVLVAASDEWGYTGAADTWRNLSRRARRDVGRVNVHGYQRDADPGSRMELRAAVGDTPVWQTEYAEGEPDGLTMALNIGRDLRYLRPSAWSCWQPVEALDWGLLDGEYDDQTPNPDGRAAGTLRGEVGGVNAKYYVLAHYTRHIRPGARILDSGHENTVASHDPAARRLTLVTAGDRPEIITYDLGLFSIAEGGGDDRAVRLWVTDAIDAAAGRRYERTPGARLDGRTLTVTHEASTVTTMEIDNVDI